MSLDVPVSDAFDYEIVILYLFHYIPLFVTQCFSIYVTILKAKNQQVRLASSIFGSTLLKSLNVR
jgi:hypothetical protein